MSDKEEVERVPLYYMWDHFHVDFRVMMIRLAMTPSDRIDYEHAGLVEWIDLPERIRKAVMVQFMELAKVKYKKLMDPKRQKTNYMFEGLEART